MLSALANLMTRSPWFRLSCRNFRVNFSTVTVHRKRAVKLSYDVFEGTANNSPIVILHGLFGSKTNWATVAKKINKETQKTIFTVDARNHGNSEWSDGMSLEAMKEDLLSLIRNDLQLNHCTLIGHSLGGRIVMVTALSQPSLIDKLVIVDVSPVPYQSIFQFQEFITAMQAVQFDQTLSLSHNRKSAGQQLQQVIQEEGLLQFILSNVVERDGHCQWRLNLDGLQDGIVDISADLPTFTSCYNGPVMFIKGSKSQYIRTEHLPAIKRLFPSATLSTVEGAGHFVHSEKPKEFLAAVLPFLKS